MEEESDSHLIDIDTVDDFTMPSPPRRAVNKEDEEEQNTYPASNMDCFIKHFPGSAGQGK